MDWLHRLDGALKLQNFRRVSHEVLTEAGEIDLRGIPADLERAMAGIQAVNDWPRVGQQLALLKRLKDFQAVYLRADEHVAKLAIVCELRGSPSTTDDYRRSFDFSWGCSGSLEPHLKNYKLSDEFMALIHSLITTYAGNHADPIVKAVNWLLLALQIHQSSGGPQAAFIGACHDGIEADLRSRLSAFWWHSDFQKRKEGFDFHAPTLQGIAWDMSKNVLSGRAETALDLNTLRAGLAISSEALVMEAFEVVSDTSGIDPRQSALGVSPIRDLAEENAVLPLLGGLGMDSRHGVRAANLALTQKGMREEPSGSNRNPYSRYFGYGAQAWCADFVAWAFDSTGNRDRKVPWGYPSNVANITRWATSRGLIVSKPEAGAIFTYQNGQHTGLVASPVGRGFLSVEGNTSGPDGHTSWVWSHQRSDDGSYFFVRFPD